MRYRSDRSGYREFFYSIRKGGYPGADPLVYTQEILQSIGVPDDQELVIPSVFSEDNISYPTTMDIQWMQRLYSRQPLNAVNDLDPVDVVRGRVDSFFRRNNDFVETRSFLDYTTVDGVKLVVSKHLGFKPRGASSGVVSKIPKNALVEYFDLSNSDIVDLDNAESYRGVLSSKDLKIINDRLNVFSNNKPEKKVDVSIFEKSDPDVKSETKLVFMKK